MAAAPKMRSIYIYIILDMCMYLFHRLDISMFRYFVFCSNIVHMTDIRITHFFVLYDVYCILATSFLPIPNQHPTATKNKTIDERWCTKYITCAC